MGSNRNQGVSTLQSNMNQGVSAFQSSQNQRQSSIGSTQTQFNNQFSNQNQQFNNNQFQRSQMREISGHIETESGNQFLGVFQSFFIPSTSDLADGLVSSAIT